jgi:hypothetical protein
MAAKMNESLVKYLAGLMDADGSLSFAFKTYERDEERIFLGLCLSLASSKAVDKRGFIPTLPTITGMGGIYFYGSEKQFMSWRVNKRSDMEMLLPRLIKHMVVKGKHWQWLLDTWRVCRGGSLSKQERVALTALGKKSRIERVGPLKPKNHPTWAWLAGYLDGDGWYLKRYAKAPHNYWAMQVGAVAHKNDICVLEFLHKAFGGNIREHGQSPHVKVWVRNLGVKDASFALRFLPKVARHSRLKRHKIDQIISHHRQQRLSVLSPAAPRDCRRIRGRYVMASPYYRHRSGYQRQSSRVPRWRFRWRNSRYAWH